MNSRKRKLHLEENDGLWVQCCKENCKKWRFVKEYEDPLSVPETWICSQNPDKKFSSCKIPEQKVKNGLIESKYIPGNIIWAKMKGYPWWPAIVDNSPETHKFYKLSASEVPVSYHVIFFGETSYAWVKPKNIKPFKENDGNQPMKKAKHLNVDSESLNKSVEIAKSALTLSIEERLKKYSLYIRSKDSQKKALAKKKKEYVKYFPVNASNKETTKEYENIMHDLQIMGHSSNCESNETKLGLSWNFCNIQ